MIKNDKLIVLLGVIILIIASIGIYTWAPVSSEQEATIESFFSITSSFQEKPTGICVEDTNPFYPLIATPLAVHYQNTQQHVVPMYVMNMSFPSDSVERAMDDIQQRVDLVIDDIKSLDEWSIDLATMYWNHSEAAMIIEACEAGYQLGVVAAPLASYLSIPIFVTDSLTAEIRQTLSDLGVMKTIVCGQNLSGWGDVLEFTCVDEIINASITIVKEQFGQIEYVSLTNPLDAWPPEVLDRKTWTLGPTTMTTSATTELIQSMSGQDTTLGTFTIPDDYKYALVKFRGINLHTDNVDDLGDNVLFSCGIVDGQLDVPSGLESFEVFAGGTNAGGVPVRDAQGNVLVDQTYSEAVLYDRGGIEYKVTATPSWLASNQGEVKAEITVEKLSDPYYPMMKGLSSLAPYLTAYRQGIILGKPEFAFAADDDALYKGKPCPGFYMPRRNPHLATASNMHVFDIHDQINDLLADIADITIEKERDIEYLREYYKNNPVCIALVGGATVLPQLIYDSSIEPIDPEAVSYYFGTGVPSDFIYGNIDPNPDDWSSQAPDLYSDSDYPYQENIVGRITGWDAQDTSALIARTIFYDDIIQHLGNWKDNAVLQMGGGNDFQKPFIRYKIFGELLNLIRHGEPMKMETGASYFNGITLKETVFEPLGFTTEYIRESEATMKGFSNEAIDQLKQANLLNKIFMSKRQINQEVGEAAVRGGELQENSNFILANAHGNQHMFGMGDVSMYKLGIGLPNGIMPKILEGIARVFGFGPGFSLSDHGYYSTRNVENMDLGPSFIWIESCICGKIDGVYPTQGVSQAYIHAGANSVIAATTCSNVPGGYLEPKRTKYDFPGQTFYRYLTSLQQIRQGIYPEQHFGFKIYEDLCQEFQDNDDITIGYAFREARNRYLPEDADWEVWWSPPLLTTGYADVDAEIIKTMSEQQPEGLDPRLDNKYLSFFEYTIYGDPAFTPYIP